MFVFYSDGLPLSSLEPLALSVSYHLQSSRRLTHILHIYVSATGALCSAANTDTESLRQTLFTINAESLLQLRWLYNFMYKTLHAFAYMELVINFYQVFCIILFVFFKELVLLIELSSIISWKRKRLWNTSQHSSGFCCLMTESLCSHAHNTSIWTSK